MALNKFMHPRNMYKTPPDFANLAKSFTDFSKIAKIDVTGKITIDFKNPHSLRVLTKCLLKKDFNLDVVIPEDRLVPTLPLRLNYVLWVEDLMAAAGRKDNIRGIDIGTGACAVYPLLAAVKNKWHMIGTESDEESLKQAKDNVQRNNLLDLIDVVKSPSKSLVDHLFCAEDAKVFDFTMCNPPFYSNLQELCDSRSPARLPPKNAFTGSPQELITDGGELAFCRKIIHESKALQDNILIFTTMVGHKYNLKELEQDLQAEGIKHTSTEFCQGRVTRWGLAWTYQDIDIAQLVPSREKARRSNGPVIYALPEIPGTPYDVENVSKKVKSLLQTLNIHFKVINKRGHNISMDIKAMTNTWSNQRRKRRLMKRLEGNDCKKIKTNESSSTENLPDSTKTTVANISQESNASNSVKDTSKNNTPEVPESTKTNEPSNTEEKTNLQTYEDKGFTGDSSHNGSKECNLSYQGTFTNDGHGVSNGKQNAEIISNTEQEKERPINIPSTIETPNSDNVYGSSSCNNNNKVPIVHAILKILKRVDEFFLEIEFLDGSSGREGLHQIVQYIKNNWK